MFLWYLFYNSQKLRINARACLKLYSVYKCIIKRREISKKICVNSHVCMGACLRGRGLLKGVAVNQLDGIVTREIFNLIGYLKSCGL